MFFLILYYLLLTLSFLLILWYMNLYWCNRGLQNIPGPTPWPFIGNAHKFSDTVELLKYLPEYERKFNSRTVKYTIGTETFLTTSDYKLSELIHTQILEKSKIYLFLTSWLGTGLLTGGGEKWKKHRRMLTPTFHFSILEKYIDVFAAASDVLIQQFRKEVGNAGFNAYKHINLCAMDIICESAMGVCVHAQTHESKYLAAVKAMCQIVVKRAMSPVYKYSFLYCFTKMYYDEKRYLKTLHGYTYSIIRKRRRELMEKQERDGDVRATNDEGGNGDDQFDGYGQRKKMVFLDLLLQASIDGNPLTDEEIREEVDTFMFEGHDTVTSAISFAIHSLAKHPDYQARVLDEQRAIFGADRRRCVTYNDLQEMHYLEMFIKETLRLYPSVPTYYRTISDRIQYENMTLEPGITLVVLVFLLHRNPDYFPDPLVFDPERFSAANNSGKFPYSYVPFSAGPRNCIGQRFAMLEMKSTLSKILREFAVLPTVPAHEPIIGVDVILKPMNGIFVRLENRQW